MPFERVMTRQNELLRRIFLIIQSAHASHAKFSKPLALAKCWVGFENLNPNTGDSFSGRNWQKKKGTMIWTIWQHGLAPIIMTTESNTYFTPVPIHARSLKTWHKQLSLIKHQTGGATSVHDSNDILHLLCQVQDILLSEVLIELCIIIWEVVASLSTVDLSIMNNILFNRCRQSHQCPL